MTILSKTLNFPLTKRKKCEVTFYTNEDGGFLSVDLTEEDNDRISYSYADVEIIISEVCKFMIGFNNNDK